MQVLVCLARRAGQVVTRQELLDTLWAEGGAGEDALNLCMSRLRRALGDDPRQPQFIETIPKSGYRLLLPVTWVSEGPNPANGVAQPGRPPRRGGRWWRRGVVSAGLLVGLVLLLDAWWAGHSNSASAVPLPRPLTSYAGRERHGAFAPDGQHLAFSWQGPAQDNWDIYVQPVGEAAPQRLTRHPAPDHRPTWSPDGQHLAFLRFVEGRCAVYLVEAQGGEAQGGEAHRLTECGVNPQADLAWSPDGTWIAFSDGDSLGLPTSLYGYHLPTQALRKLTAPALGYLGDHSPAFAPDGQALAFTRTREAGVADVYQVALDGGPPQRASFLNRAVQGLTWSADGTRLVFSSDRSGYFNLWSVPARGGLATRLTTPTAATLLDPTYLPGRTGILYEQWSYDTDIWQYTWGDTASARPLLVSTQPDFAPRFSPAGDAVAFVSRRSGHDEIWIAQADGQHPRQHTTLAGPRLRDLRWSPQGDRLVFIARPEEPTDAYRPLGTSDLYLLTLATGTVEPLTHTPGDVRAPAWSADGQSLYFADVRADTWQVHQWSLTSGVGQRVSLPEALQVAESVDGTTRYYTRFGQPGLWAAPVEGGEHLRLLAASGLGHFGPWTVREEGIYFLRRRREAVELACFRFDTRSVVPVMTLPRQSLVPDVSLAPEGKQVLVVRAHRSESDLMWVSLAAHGASTRQRDK